MNHKLIHLKNLIKNGEELFEIIYTLPISMFFDKKINDINKNVLKKGMEELGGDWILQNNINYFICKRIEDTPFEEITLTSSNEIK